MELGKMQLKRFEAQRQEYSTGKSFSCHFPAVGLIFSINELAGIQESGHVFGYQSKNQKSKMPLSGYAHPFCNLKPIWNLPAWTDITNHPGDTPT